MTTAKQQISNFEKILFGLVKDTVASNRGIKAFGKAAIDIIVKRTRRGYGVRKTASRQYRFAKLSPGYIEKRKRSKLDPTTSPAKSNLTFSGQLLRSLVVSPGQGGSFTIRPNARGRKGGITNQELADVLAKRNDRIFLNLSGSELKTITGLYEVGLAAAIKKQL